MKPGAKRILVLIAGWSFILLGIAGLFLPFLQGVLFILVGLIILSSQYAWARLLLRKLRQRFPEDRSCRGCGYSQGRELVAAPFSTTQNGLMRHRRGANLQAAKSIMVDPVISSRAGANCRLSLSATLPAF